MRLSSKAILNFANINNFDFGNQWAVRAGDPNTLYFQLVDLDQMDPPTKSALRYIPASGAIVTVTFPSIDSAAVVTVTAALANAADGSLWSVALTSTQIPATGNVLMSVNEGGAVRTFSVINMMSVEYPSTSNSC